MKRFKGEILTIGMVTHNEPTVFYENVREEIGKLKGLLVEVQYGLAMENGMRALHSALIIGRALGEEESDV